MRFGPGGVRLEPCCPWLDPSQGGQGLAARGLAWLAPCRVFEVSNVSLGALEWPLGALWGTLGHHLGGLGRLLGSLGHHVGPLGRHLGALGRHVGAKVGPAGAKVAKVCNCRRF